MPLMHSTDTEGSFMVERAVEIADACIRHLKKLAINNGTAAQKEAVSTLSILAQHSTHVSTCILPYAHACCMR